MTKQQRNTRILTSALTVWGILALGSWAAISGVDALFAYASIDGFYRAVANALLVASVGTVAISIGLIVTFHACLNINRLYVSAQQSPRRRARI